MQETFSNVTCMNLHGIEQNSPRKPLETRQFLTLNLLEEKNDSSVGISQWRAYV